MNESLNSLFSRWNELNAQIAQDLGSFDFESIKKIRKEQKQIENSIYDEVLLKAPQDIKQILPEECGEMEMGYEMSKNKFYFVMEAPDQDEEGPMILDAITIDSSGNVELIKDFEPPE
ncbi:MAG: hypothetical protein GF383_07585 [Candidatus Lokiarchaeota archaeon]|nr:hypothetical protein [Candidatus Lokiarchaeota archaeon]MBD3340112.1 hypothetical protein [Candidatus Lokiarchaeota archaeon]